MRALIVVICLICLLPGVVSGAENTASAAIPASQSSTDPQYGPRRNQQSPDEAKIERDMAKKRNKERQQKLKEDTDKLLKLATELKQYVDKTNDEILSIEVLKKTDEIEKLAKSVREKMKAGSYDGVPQ